MLMKKIFTLIATALLTMGASAQTTVFSWEAGTATGGTVEAKGSNNAPDDTKITVNSKKADIDVNNVTITLNEALAAGDKIAITGYRNKDTDANGTLYIDFSTGTAIDEGDEVKWNNIALGQEANTNEYTITDQAGSTVIRMARSKASTNVFITKIVITRTGGGTTPEFWDASTLDLTTAISSRENKNENLKTVPEQYPGEAPATEQIKADATAALVLTDYIFTVNTTSVTLTGVSTPNSDGTQADAWRIGSTNTNQFLNTDACPVKFEGGYLQAKTGNPSMSDIEYFFTNSDGGRVGPRTVEDYWEPNCGKLPAKGEYIEVAFSNAGTFVAGLFIQRPTSNLYIIDKETTQLLAPSAITIAGYNNNNTVKPAEDADAYQPMKVNDDYTISFANPDYTINAGKQVFGHVSFNVEAGKTYLLFNPKNQLGIYGFQFTPGGDPAGVETIKTEKVWNADAPMYNLSGQKVDKSYKGIVIQNGRKFVNK